MWNSFSEFYKDMWESYEAHVKEFGEYETTIDRIDANWDYCKENCRWATMKEQANNTSRCKKIIYNWVEYPSIVELSKAIWMSYNWVRRRIEHNKL